MNKLSTIYHDHWEQKINGVDEDRFDYFLKKSYCFFDDGAFQIYRKYKSVTKSCKAYNAIPSKGNDCRLKTK